MQGVLLGRHILHHVRRLVSGWKLMKVLRDIEGGHLHLVAGSLNIVYVGYDMLYGEPVVCGDPDYAAQMRARVILLI